MNEQQVIHRASASWPESKAKIVVTLTKEPNDDQYHIRDRYAVHIHRFKGIRDVGGSSNHFTKLADAVRFYKKKILETLPAGE